MNILKTGLLLFFISSCQTNPDYTKLPRTKGSVEAGSQVKKKGQPINLHKGSLKVGDQLAPILADISDVKLGGKVTIINIVPSIDTPVCEAQSHILGESKEIAPGIQKITISRDTPMAQNRFQREASLTNVTFVSDFTHGRFGKKTGLLMTPNQLLARAIIVVDQSGKIAHLQISDDITKLPDMEAAFAKANALLVK